jgi:hypothetical protein
MLPNIIMVHPPNTASGRELKIALIAGINPAKTRIAARRQLLGD